MEEKRYKVYVHKTPDGMYYAGVTGMELSVRWQPSLYNSGHSLWPYIEKYGWENIEHAVIFETDDRKNAYEIEDYLILFYRNIGRGINKMRSGLFAVTDKQSYEKQWRDNNKEYMKQYMKQYNSERKIKRMDYDKARNSTPEGKIYQRVHNFNRIHPDRAIETPLEAKRKFLEFGYVPDYIKHDDIVNIRQ